MSFGLTSATNPFSTLANSIYPSIVKFRQFHPMADLSKLDEKSFEGFPGGHVLFALPAGGFVGYALPRINSKEGLGALALGAVLTAHNFMASTSSDNLATTIALWSAAFLIGAATSATSGGLSGRVKEA